MFLARGKSGQHRAAYRLTADRQQCWVPGTATNGTPSEGDETATLRVAISCKPAPEGGSPEREGRERKNDAAMHTVQINDRQPPRRLTEPGLLICCFRFFLYFSLCKSKKDLTFVANLLLNSTFAGLLLLVISFIAFHFDHNYRANQ